MNEPVPQPSPDRPNQSGHETTDASPFYIGLFAPGVGTDDRACIASARLDLLAVGGRGAAGGHKAKPVGRRPDAARAAIGGAVRR